MPHVPRRAAASRSRGQSPTRTLDCITGLAAAAAGSPAPAPVEQLAEAPAEVISWGELLRDAVPCVPESASAAVRVARGCERVVRSDAHPAVFRR